MKKYINLLPPDYQRDARLGRLNFQILSFGIWSIASLLIFAAILFASFVVLRQRLSGVEQEIVGESKVLDELKETSVRKEVEAYGQNLKNFETLTKARDNWSAVLVELANDLEKDMTLDTLTVGRLDRKVEVAGHAGSRSSVLKFRQSLIASAHFVNVNFPLANLEKPKDLNWKYRFYVKPEFLK